MARRTKTQKIEVEVEEALEKAMDFDFDKSSFEDLAAEDADSLIDLDDLAQQIAAASEETASEKKRSTPDAPVVDESVAAQLFNNVPPELLSPTGGTVRDSLVSARMKPANDDQNKSRAHQILRSKPYSRLYWSTTALSAIWAIGGVITASHISPNGIRSLSSIGSFLSTTTGAGVLAGTALPILMFWGFAQLTKRAKELQSVVKSMAETALQLSAPKQTPETPVHELAKSVREEVAAMEDGIGRTLARAAELEALVHGEVQNLERAYAENETRIHKLINELSDEREAIQGHADRVKMTLHNSRDELSQQFGVITSDLKANVENLSITLSKTFEEKSGVIFDHIDKSGQEIADKIVNKLEATVNEVTNTNQRLFGNLSEHFEQTKQRFNTSSVELVNQFKDSLNEAEHQAEEISRRLGQSADTTISRFDQKFQSIDDALADRSNNTINNFEEKLANLSELTHDVMAKVDKKLDAFNASMEERDEKSLQIVETRLSNLNTTANNVIEALDSRFATLDTAIEQRSRNTLSQFEGNLTVLNQRSAEMTDKFDLTAQDTINVFEKQVSRLDETLGVQTRTAINNFFERAQILEQNTEKLASLLDVRASQINDNLKERTLEISQTLIGGSDNFIANMDEHRNKFQADIAKVEDSLQSMLSEKSENMVLQLSRGRDLLYTVMQDQTSHVTDTVKQQIDVLSNHLTGIENVLVERVNAINTQANFHVEQIDTRAAVLQTAIDKSFETVKEVIDIQSANIDARAEALRDSLTVNSSGLNEVLNNQTRVLEQRIERINELIEQGNVQFGDAINKQVTEFERVFIDNGAIIQTSFEDHLKTLKAHTELLQNALDQSDELRAAVEVKKADIDEAFKSQISVIEERTDTMQRALENGVGNVRESLEQSAVGLAAALRDRIVEAASSFSMEAKNAGVIVDEIGSKLNATISQFEDNLNNAQTGLDTRLADRKHLIMQSIDILEKNLSERMDAIGHKITEINESGSNAITAQFEHLNTVTQNVYHLANESTQSFTSVAQQLGEQLKNVAEETQTNWINENQRLVNTIAEKTNETIQAVQSLGGSLNEDANQILDQMNRSVNNIHEGTEMLMSGVQKIDGHFSAIANSFHNNAEKISENISAASTMLTGNINTLRGVTEQSMGQFSNITNNFNQHAQLLTNAAQLLDGTLNSFGLKLEEKQNAIYSLASGLNEKSNEIEQSISQFETAIVAALNNTQSAAKQSTYELRKELAALVSDAAHRFAGATEQLRQSTSEIRAELSQTTSDIKESVRAIPGQAKESTAAVRQAVTEQVKALKDLANIVQMSGRVTDVAVPTTAMKVQPTRNSAKEAETRNDKRSFETASAASVKSGWVSDLLARASKNEVRNEESAAVTERVRDTTSPRSETTSSDSLTSLAGKIVRGINDGALAVLWNNYRRGQKNILEERLYTVEGQNILNNIRRRYRVDAEFKRTANQYIADFEKLLRDVSRRPNSVTTVREYLTSETGKVYTMLAHASGRIH